MTFVRLSICSFWLLSFSCIDNPVQSADVRIPNDVQQNEDVIRQDAREVSDVTAADANTNTPDVESVDASRLDAGVVDVRVPDVLDAEAPDVEVPDALPLTSGLDYGRYEYETGLPEFSDARIRDAIIHENELHLLGVLEQDNHIVHMALSGAGIPSINERFDDEFLSEPAREFISGFSTPDGVLLFSVSGRETFASTSLSTNVQQRFTPAPNIQTNLRRQNDAILVGGIESPSYESVLISADDGFALQKRYDVSGTTLSFEDVARNGSNLMAIGVLLSPNLGGGTIAALNVQGEVQNSFLIPGYIFSQVRRIPQSDDFVVMGVSEALPFEDLLLIRIGPNGELRWAKTYDYGGNPVEVSLVVNEDKIYAAGAIGGATIFIESDLEGNVISGRRLANMALRDLVQWPNGDLTFVGDFAQRWTVIHTDDKGIAQGCDLNSQPYEVEGVAIEPNTQPLTIIENDLELTQSTEPVSTSPLVPEQLAICVDR